MCLAIPGRIERIVADPSGERSAVVEYPGEQRTVSLLYLPDVAVGDYVVVQAGFAIRRLTPAQAKETFDAMEEAGARTLPAQEGEA